MNKIQQLIQQLCPQGVERKELGEIVEILDSQRKPVSKSNRVVGKYPYYGANGIQDYVDEYIFDGTFILLGEDGSVINKDGSPVLNWATGKIWVNNHAHILAEKSNIAILRYVYFALAIIDVTKVVKGNIPKITQQNLRGFQIPIPPLPIQQEIVKILDSFTQLEAELEAELEARRAQYEYYRNRLLSATELNGKWLMNGVEVEWKSLGEVISALRTGLNPRQNFKLNNAEAKNFYVTVRELNGFTIKITDKTDKVDSLGLKLIQNRSKIQIGDILFSGTGTIGRTALVNDFPNNWNIKEGIYVLTPITNIINAKFLIYLLQSSNIYNQIIAKADGSTVSSISMASLQKIQIPIPPLAEQERIVGILDKFDALVNDISIGLPAEIDGRRKQYNYYRGKLLDFKPLTTNH